MKRAREGGATSSRNVGPLGFQQRVRLATELEDTVDRRDSSLANLLIEQWSWGQLSTPQIQRIAAAAKADFEAGGHTVPDQIENISAIGSHGRHTGHLFRDLTKYKIKQPILASARVDYTMWIRKIGFRTKQSPISIVLPHALFSLLYHSNRQAFGNMLLGSTNEISKFWDEVASTQKYQHHPVRRRKDHKRLCIPLGLHGDGVAVTGINRSWQKSVDAYSWSSLLASGQTKLTNFLVFVAIQGILCTSPDKSTMDEFWRVLSWSLNALYRGRWPTSDHNNEPIQNDDAGKFPADGCYGCLWLVKGDLDLFSEILSSRGRRYSISLHALSGEFDRHPLDSDQSRERILAEPPAVEGGLACKPSCSTMYILRVTWLWPRVDCCRLHALQAPGWRPVLFWLGAHAVDPLHRRDQYV